MEKVEVEFQRCSQVNFAHVKTLTPQKNVQTTLPSKRFTLWFTLFIAPNLLA